MVFSLDSSKLYLSILHPSPAFSGIMVVDTRTWTIIKEIQGIGPDLQTPALTYDGKYVLTPFSGFQRQSSGIAVIDTSTDTLIGILPSNGGHHDCVIIPTKLEHMKHTRSCTLVTALAAAQPGAAESRAPQGAQPVAGRRGGAGQRRRVHRRDPDASHRSQHGGRLHAASAPT